MLRLSLITFVVSILVVLPWYLIEPSPTNNPPPPEYTARLTKEFLKALETDNLILIAITGKVLGNVDIIDELGNTPLINAINDNDSELAAILLIAGADYNLKGGLGKSAYELAKEKNNHQVIKAINEYGKSKLD